MSTAGLVLIAGSGVGAIIAAGIFGVETNSYTPTTIVAGITAVTLAVLYATKTLTPAISDAIKAITPAIVDAIKAFGDALIEVKKQREAFYRESLTGKLAALQRALEEKADALTEVTRKAAADLAEVNRLRDEKIGELKDEIHELREYNGRLLTRMSLRQEHQDIEISETKAATVENRAAIERIDAGRSGEMPAVRKDGNDGPTE